MPRFRYVALDASGQEVRGALVGPSPLWVSAELGRDHLLTLEVEPESEREGALAELRRRLPVTHGDIALFSSQFAIMLDAGVPLLTALELLAENSVKPRLREALLCAVENIRSGKTLHQGFAASGIFPRVYLSMVAAAEQAGTLDAVMRQLATYLDREAELRGRLQKALAYPAFLVLLSVAVVTFLVASIIPRFGAVLEQLGVELPWPTRTLMVISRFCVADWPLILGGTLVLFAAAAMVLRSETARHRLDGLALRAPLLGSVVTRSGLARFAYVLGSLLAGGIPIVEALDSAQETTGNRALGAAVGKASRRLVEGGGVAESLAATGAFPSLVLQMVTIGETTGNLDQVLAHIAELYDQQVERATHTLISLVEPSLIVVLGLVVGFIALSMVLPMVKAVSSIGG